MKRVYLLSQLFFLFFGALSYAEPVEPGEHLATEIQQMLSEVKWAKEGQLPFPEAHLRWETLARSLDAFLREEEKCGGLSDPQIAQMNRYYNRWVDTFNEWQQDHSWYLHQMKLECGANWLDRVDDRVTRFLDTIFDGLVPGWWVSAGDKHRESTLRQTESKAETSFDRFYEKGTYLMTMVRNKFLILDLGEERMVELSEEASERMLRGIFKGLREEAVETAKELEERNRMMFTFSQELSEELLRKFPTKELVEGMGFLSLQEFMRSKLDPFAREQGLELSLEDEGSLHALEDLVIRSKWETHSLSFFLRRFLNEALRYP